MFGFKRLKAERDELRTEIYLKDYRINELNITIQSLRLDIEPWKNRAIQFRNELDDTRRAAMGLNKKLNEANETILELQERIKKAKAKK